MTTPEVKKNFPVYTCAGRLLGGQTGRGRHPIISVDIPPQASVVGSILAKSCAKSCAKSWGGSQGQSGVKKETRYLAKCKQRPEGLPYISDFNHLFTALLIQDACTPLWVCISALLLT